MTDARLEPIEPDPFLAAGFLDRAKRFAVDGTSPSLGAESGMVLLHNAVICACDAVLAIEGRRVVGSDGGHQLRLAEAERLLPQGGAALFDTLDNARAARNQVSYAAAVAPLDGMTDTTRAVNQLIELCDARIRPQLPEWLSGG